MIVDLHAHYAMHLVPKTAGTPIDLFSTASGRGWPRDRLRARLIGRRIAGRDGVRPDPCPAPDQRWCAPQSHHDLFDGFIKPTMGGLESMTDMRRLEQALRDRYGVEDAERICSGNTLRVLRAGWRS